MSEVINNEVLNNRYNFVILFDVKDGNPNGDPNSGNMPRMDLETNHGLVTDVCLKRKIRNYVELIKEDAPGYGIYIKKGVPLNSCELRAYEYLGLNSDDVKNCKQTIPDVEKKITDFLCKEYFDIRTFGAVMTTFQKDHLNAGQVKGPVQINPARSIDPIFSQELTITRVATTGKNALEKTHTMGRKSIVPYGLYKAEGSVSALQAQNITGFTEDDLELLWTAIINMFEEDCSAARARMSVKELIVFKHEGKTSSVPSDKLYDLVEVHKKEGVLYPRSYSDYEVIIHEDQIPQNVEMTRKI